MSSRNTIPIGIVHEVRDNCYCLHLQRAARSVARRFDDGFRPLGLTSGQFSLLMSLNRPEAPTIGEVATMLAMDRTTLTANLKPLERRGVIESFVNANDRRSRRVRLTKSGVALLAAAVPVWRRVQREIGKIVSAARAVELRDDLDRLTARNGIRQRKQRNRG